MITRLMADDVQVRTNKDKDTDNIVIHSDKYGDKEEERNRQNSVIQIIQVFRPW